MMNNRIEAPPQNEPTETSPGEFLARSLLQTRTVLISDAIDHKLTQKVVAQLLLLDEEDPEKPVKVLINSPGGNPDDGFAIYDTMRFIRPTVSTLNVGLSASAATILMLGAPKDRRFALPNARIMIHQPWGQAPGAQAENIKRWAEQILKLRERINRLYAEETGHSIEKIQEDTDRDYWMSPEEAVEYGLLSKVITSYEEIP
ncbi:MAG: ATP-dependent Clp protease proteolytic subunit [bacterium]|nr:ATP-dependent Clp protease proteolytic subunit [bacterium]